MYPQELQQTADGLLAFLLPSHASLVWMTTGLAVGVAVGCAGANTLRPCALLNAAPVIVAVAALYAAAYVN